MAVAEIALEDDNHYFVKTIKYFIGGANIKTLTSKQKPKLAGNLVLTTELKT